MRPKTIDVIDNLHNNLSNFVNENKSNISFEIQNSLDKVKLENVNNLSADQKETGIHPDAFLLINEFTQRATRYETDEDTLSAISTDEDDNSFNPILIEKYENILTMNQALNPYIKSMVHISLYQVYKNYDTGKSTEHFNEALTITESIFGVNSEEYNNITSVRFKKKINSSFSFLSSQKGKKTDNLNSRRLLGRLCSDNRQSKRNFY